MPTEFSKLKSADQRHLDRIARASGYEHGGRELFEEVRDMVIGGDAVGWKEIAALIGFEHHDSARRAANQNRALGDIVKRGGKGTEVRANKHRLLLWAQVNRNKGTD